MDIFQIVGIAFIGAILSITIKNYKPEIAILIGISTGLVILYFTFSSVSEVFNTFEEIMSKSGIDLRYFAIVIKIIGIAYLTQFASEICKDCGENAIAMKLEFAGKMCVMVLAMPIISAFLDVVIKTLSGF